MTDPYVNLDAENIAEHHLCCALGDPKHRQGVEDKKAWLRDRFPEGLVFRKLDVRGKVFIEYAPAEVAWRPFDAPGWMAIHCLWVSGRFARKGHGSNLLAYCQEDARQRGLKGVVIASGSRKRPFLADRRWLAKRGFQIADRAGDLLLMALPFDPAEPLPRFHPRVHDEGTGRGPFLARFTPQCPFNRHWAPRVVEHLRDEGYAAETEAIETLMEAQRVRSPLGAYGLEQGGGLVCHHLTTDGATDRLLAKRKA